MESEGSKGASKDAADGDRGMCKRCNSAKPPRAHHCSVCGRCVLRMDHHCPFTNCCVGLLNERYFVAWVFSVWLGCLYGSLLSWQPFVLCIWGGLVNGVDSLSPLDLERCTTLGKACFILLLAACLLAFMTVLLVWHLFLISQVVMSIQLSASLCSHAVCVQVSTCKPLPAVNATCLPSNFLLSGLFFV